MRWSGEASWEAGSVRHKGCSGRCVRGHRGGHGQRPSGLSSTGAVRGAAQRARSLGDSCVLTQVPPEPRPWEPIQSHSSAACLGLAEWDVKGSRVLLEAPSWPNALSTLLLVLQAESRRHLGLAITQLFSTQRSGS